MEWQKQNTLKIVVEPYTFTVKDEETGLAFNLSFDFEGTDYRAVVSHRAPKELESKCRELRDDFVVRGEEKRFEVYKSGCE